MAERDTSNWNIYDYLDAASYNGWKRRCPKCGETDVKFAIHTKAIAGCEVSVRCNDCGHEESGDMPDTERLVRAWHEGGTK